MPLEIVLLMFVRSLREANVEMLVTCIKAIVPWMFDLDHVNYARWLPVYLQDFENMHGHANLLYGQFSDGNFTVKEKIGSFSNISIDHANKQNNNLAKSDGEAVGILDCPRALLKWSVAGLEITSMLKGTDDDLQY